MVLPNDSKKTTTATAQPTIEEMDKLKAENAALQTQLNAARVNDFETGVREI